MQSESVVQWGPCCFCGRDVPGTVVDPCSVKVETATKNWQVWFCHASCFKERLANRPDGLFSPAHF